MSTGNETNFEALLLAFNGPRDCHSKHYAPSASSQIVHADDNDSNRHLGTVTNDALQKYKFDQSHFDSNDSVAYITLVK